MADVDAFLQLIKSLESDNNPNVVHRTIASGMHAGDAAVGEAGIMPNTAKEMAARRIATGNNSMADDLMAGASNDDASAMLQSNPDLRNQYVQDLGERVMSKTNNDPALAATAWLYGHNLPKSKLEQLLQDNPTYQDRINRKIEENHLSSEQPQIAVPSLQERLDALNKNVPQPMSKIRSLIQK